MSNPESLPLPPQPETVDQFCKLAKALNGREIELTDSNKCEFNFYEFNLDPATRESAWVDTETGEEYSGIIDVRFSTTEFDVELGDFLKETTVYEWGNDGKLRKFFLYEKNPDFVETEEQKLVRSGKRKLEGLIGSDLSSEEIEAIFSRKEVEAERKNPLTEDNIKDLNVFMNSLLDSK